MSADDGAARPATAPMTGADPWDLAQKVGEALMTRDHAAQRLGIVLEEIRLWIILWSGLKVSGSISVKIGTAPT